MTRLEHNDMPGEMYLVKDKKTDTFQLHTRKGAWQGPLRKIWAKMHFEFGIKNSEIRFALSEMEWKDHLAAHFGIFGGFIYTQAKFPVK